MSPDELSNLIYNSENYTSLIEPKHKHFDPNYLKTYLRPGSCPVVQNTRTYKIDRYKLTCILLQFLFSCLFSIKRQTAVDWTVYENRHSTLKSKSLQIQEPEVARARDRCMSTTAESGDTENQKKGKKKKRKGNGVWLKKVKNVANANEFIRKSGKM